MIAFSGLRDCGTGGEIDVVCDEYKLNASQDRIAGLFTPAVSGISMQRIKLYNDYLAKHFDRLVFQILGIDLHPELLDVYFGNYERVLYLAK